MVRRGERLLAPVVGVVGEDGRQDLQRNLTPQLGVGSAIDFSHAAHTELLRDAIMRNTLAYHRNVSDLMSVS